MTLPASGRIAVYTEPNAPFQVQDFPIREPRADEALVKVSMSTICRSDIHSYQGHRPSPCPGLLGHEIVGNIVALGEGITHDMRGDRLSVGDRITWSEFFIPGDNYFSEVLDLPQKSHGVEKYGHMAATTAPHHHGGFAEYCYVLPKSWILRLPDNITDAEATPINCGVATMVAVTEAANIRLGSTVVIQGLGLLGLYGAALAKSRGAKYVIGLDVNAKRREQALRFGVDMALDPSLAAADLLKNINTLCRPEGADTVIEVCGVPEVLPLGLEIVRVGGTYVIAGLVSPGAHVTLDANRFVKKMITLKGVHNYHPRHLIEALDFVVKHKSQYPFAELVDGQYALDDVTQAMSDAASQRVLRAAIVP
ncbi:MAG: 5-exo-hydroxycamphor dehydrogenase [Pseudomonadota bacterium]|jgi:alcohol dehydrogenase